MSAIKERQLVWEENGKLKFCKLPPNDHLRALAREPLLEGDKLVRYVAKLGDKHERIGMVTGKKALILPKDHERGVPYVDRTPRDWRRVSIRAAGDLFDLVAAGSHVPFLQGDRDFYAFPEELMTEGLRLEDALEYGSHIENLIQQRDKRDALARPPEPETKPQVYEPEPDELL